MRHYSKLYVAGIVCRVRDALRRFLLVPEPRADIVMSVNDKNLAAITNNHLLSVRQERRGVGASAADVEIFSPTGPEMTDCLCR